MKSVRLWHVPDRSNFLFLLKEVVPLRHVCGISNVEHATLFLKKIQGFSLWLWHVWHVFWSCTDNGRPILRLAPRKPATHATAVA